METTGKATVYVVDDDKTIRDGIANLVGDMGSQPQTFASAEEFLDCYECSGPDCLILDVRMPGMSGVELLSELAAKNYFIPTIIITGHGDIAMAVEAIKKGAVDFIEKPFREQELWSGIKNALKISNDSNHVLLEKKSFTEKTSLLTDKEREVMKFLIDGGNDKEIANKMGVSRRAVAFHRTSIFDKLEIANAVELVKKTFMFDLQI